MTLPINIFCKFKDSISLFSLNIFYSTISYIYTHAIYIINRIRTEASAYLVLFLLFLSIYKILLCNYFYNILRVYNILLADRIAFTLI